MSITGQHPPRRARVRGFMLITLVALLAVGGLFFFVASLTPAMIEARRQQATSEALAEARAALLGYALRYRDLMAAQDADFNDSDDRAMYGYLPLPDLGSSRNNNSGCAGEGCDAAYADFSYDANGMPPTLVGRFPWKALGTGPLRDAHGECLWLIVSSGHGRIQRTSPPATPHAMNWDTLGHLDVVTARGETTLRSVLAGRHERPIAIIFSPGPVLEGQDRGTSATDEVATCGGNYDAANYLESLSATLNAGTEEERTVPTNRFAGTTNKASGSTTPDPANANPALRDNALPVSLGGVISQTSAGALIAGDCNGCVRVANDEGVALTADQLFTALRKGSGFRSDLNSLMDRIVSCLQMSMVTPEADGRLPTHTCYDDDTHPLGYFTNWRDMFFLTTAAAPYTVNGTPDCAAVVVFAGSRSASQNRRDDSDRALLENYLEGGILAAFTSGGATLDGPTTITADGGATDVVRCVPGAPAQTLVESPNLSATQQLVAYDAGSGTLTLGKENVVNITAGAGNLFGCAWLAETKALEGGFRSYFQFTFKTVGTSVGNTGFVFAITDAESNTGNPSLPCGMAGSHLGYSGDNSVTTKIAPPKIGIEFDQSRDTGFPLTSASQNTTSAGRNDPCGASGCGGSIGYNTHAAIVYWGHDANNATDGVLRPDNDDNVHGFPSAASLAATRKPPKNPNASPGIEFVNLRTGGRLFHVRVEVSPKRVADSATPEHSRTDLATTVWILADSIAAANQVAAMKNTTRPMSQLLATGFSGTLLSDTASIFDVAGSACNAGACPSGQRCGTDNICYRQGMKTLRLGFTGSQRTQDQEVTITTPFTTWLP